MLHFDASMMSILSQTDSLEEGADLRIVPAKVTEDSTLGDKEAEEGRVRLEKFGAVDREDIDRSELGYVLGEDASICTLSFLWGITQEISNGFCSGGKTMNQSPPVHVELLQEEKEKHHRHVFPHLPKSVPLPSHSESLQSVALPQPQSPKPVRPIVSPQAH